MTWAPAMRAWGSSPMRSPGSSVPRVFAHAMNLESCVYAPGDQGAAKLIARAAGKLQDRASGEVGRRSGERSAVAHGARRPDNPDRAAFSTPMSRRILLRTEGSNADFNFNRVGFTLAPVVAHRSRTLVVAMSSSRRSAFAVRRSNLG